MLINIPDPVVKEYFVKSLADLEKRHGRFYVYDTGDYPPFSAYSLLLQKYLPSDTPETKTNVVFSREQRLRQLCESETPHMQLDPSSETLRMLCEHIPENTCNNMGSLLGRLLLVVSIRKQQDKMSEFEFNNPVSETNDLVWQSIVTFCGRVKPLVSDEVISIIEQNWPEAKKTVLALLINSGDLFGAERGPLDLKGWGDLSRINFSNQKVLPKVNPRTKIVPPNEPLETTLARFQGVSTKQLAEMIG